MNFNFAGKSVKGKYIGKIPVSGKVIHTIEQNRWYICHCVELDQPVDVNGEMRNILYVTQEELTQVEGIDLFSVA